MKAVVKVGMMAAWWEMTEVVEMVELWVFWKVRQ